MNILDKNESAFLADGDCFIPVLPALVVMTGLLLPTPSPAAAVVELHGFDCVEVYPNALTQTADGGLYGTTYMADSTGAKGMAYEITTNGLVTPLTWFTGANAGRPVGRLVAATDGYLYGATADGGVHQLGSMFRLSTNGTLTTLHSFDGTDGASPAVGLIQATDGSLYGTTLEGGANDLGTLFRITPAGALTVLVSFDGTNGSYPSAPVLQGSDGNLYAVAGARVIRVALDGTYTNWVDLPGGPKCSVFEYTNNVFHTVVDRNIVRAEFTASPGGSGFELSSPSFSGTNGEFVPAIFVPGTNGSLYGITSFGGAYDKGTVYRLDLSNKGQSAILTTLVSFDGSNGASPEAELLLASDGSFYGTTQYRGPGLPATIFRVTHAGVLATLHRFTSLEGANPHAALVSGTNGNYFGTAYRGGEYDEGATFEITPTGDLISSNTLTFADGSSPNASLTPTTEGGFLGTTVYGGTGGGGAIFKLTAFGTITNLASFGSRPFGALVQGTNGLYYGTTRGLGNGSDGTIFSLGPAGTSTTLVAFIGDNGAHPWAGLTLGSDGNLYGTTAEGGSNDLGTVFRMTHAGALTTLVHFDSTNNGSYPTGRLVEGTNGNFYGTTQHGGPYGYGTVFEMTPSGAWTSLVSFNWTNGFGPRAGLIEGVNGNFFGTTVSGGAHGFGTLFEVIPAGALTTLLSFDESTGAEPLSEPVEAVDGTLYVTTSRGGSQGGGNVLRIGQDDFIITQIIPSSGQVDLVWNSLPGQSYQVQYKAAHTQATWTDLVAQVATNFTSSAVDSNPDSSNRLYRVVLVQ